MSVIFTAKGCVVYPTRSILKANVTRLQDTNQMNDDKVWVDGSHKPFSPDKKQVYPEWNGLILPRAFNYRNLSTGKLLEDAEWARVILFAGPMDETHVHNADHDIIQRIHMEDWFRENVLDETPHAGWTFDYIDEVWDPINTEPPAELKERMRIKNAARETQALHRELDL
jgi:hypothetical protein